MQNCPKRRSEATRRPFGNTVTWVALLCSGSTVAYFSTGMSASGLVSGGSCVTICCDGTLTVLAPATLALPLVASVLASWSFEQELLVCVEWLTALEENCFTQLVRYEDT